MISVIALLIVLCIAAAAALSVYMRDGRTDGGKASANQSSVYQNEAASSGTAVQSSQPSDDSSVSGGTAENGITLEDAKQTALKDAGVDGDSAIKFTKQKLDRELTGDEYELEFNNGVTEWEYEIDFKTGKILSSSFEAYNFD